MQARVEITSSVKKIAAEYRKCPECRGVGVERSKLRIAGGSRHLPRAGWGGTAATKVASLVPSERDAVDCFAGVICFIDLRNTFRRRAWRARQ